MRRTSDTTAVHSISRVFLGIPHLSTHERRGVPGYVKRVLAPSLSPGDPDSIRGRVSSSRLSLAIPNRMRRMTEASGKGFAGRPQWLCCGHQITTARRIVAPCTKRRRTDVLNRSDRSTAGEAEIRYLDGDFRVVRPGAFVRCAVTGVPIPLEELKYWSVDLQEAYASPQAVLQRHFPEHVKPV
jgi:hypothetical protein